MGAHPFNFLNQTVVSDVISFVYEFHHLIIGTKELIEILCDVSSLLILAALDDICWLSNDLFFYI